ncbi:MAG TPA: type II toxin-antitoxin system VapC family toxin [Treponemataceae bacterium]|nr:type II toxin-antitoxin system VapC family toxin [Treponemataceae bacterium]
MPRSTISRSTCNVSSGYTYTLSELSDNCKKAQFTILPLTISHLEEIALLALLHRDPFDRLLIAQALAEKLIIITKDEIIPSYPVKTLW